MMTRSKITTLLAALSLVTGGATTHSATAQDKAVGGEVGEVVYATKPETLERYLCRPSVPGPFPAVMYNHGGVGNIIAGAPKATREAVAIAGSIAPECCRAR